MIRRLFSKDTPETTPGTPDDPPAPGDASALDSAYDLAAALLRDFGAQAFPLDDLTPDSIRDLCEGWALHLLIGAPRPGREAQPAPQQKRDVNGLRQFFQKLRQEEHAFVNRSTGALRQTVWSFIQALDSLVTREDAGDERLRGRLARLKQAAQGGAAADLLREEVVAAVEEIGKLATERREALRDRVTGLSHQVNELGSQLETARQEGTLDALTQLYNRKAFDEKLEQLAKMSQLFGKPVTLLLIDLDHFKAVNDTHGHVAGDAVLRHVADQLCRTFRVRSDFVARYGGEEFAALLWETPIESARVAAGRLIDRLAEVPARFGDQVIPMSASIGGAQCRSVETPTAWVERADRALYAAKAQGRNRFLEAEAIASPSAHP